MKIKYVTDIKQNMEFYVSSKTAICYSSQEPEYKELETRYHLSAIAGKSDLEKATSLLAWVNRHIRHNGSYANLDQQDALTLLDVAFDKDYGINCLSMSIILCECLLAVSVRARVVYMMPKSAEDCDNHVVVEAYSSERGKWIMLDPTYGSSCVDDRGELLSLLEIRNCIASEKPFYFSECINYNGESVEDLEDVKDYYAKNLFFLRCKQVQGYGQHREYGNMMEIAPVGFDVHTRMVENLKHRIETYGDFEMLRIWLRYEEALDNQYIDIASIY